jgi:hypothetical protein
MFMLLVAAISAALIPVTPTDLWDVNYFCVGVSLLWAVLYAIQDRAHRREGISTQGPSSGPLKPPTEDPTEGLTPPPAPRRHA